MKLKFIVTLLIALGIFATADAAKIDAYRNAIQNKTFTLKYKVSTFPVHVTNREAHVNLRSIGHSIAERGHFSEDSVNTGGVIVFNKDTSYIENFHDAYRRTTTVVDSQKNKTESKTNVREGGTCTLTKDGELYGFFWDMKDGAKRYYGSAGAFGIKSSKIKAISEEKLQENIDKYSKYVNPYEIMSQEYNFGNSSLMNALAAVIPADKIIATPDTPVYRFVGSGTLDSGLSYEDFSGEKNGVFNAIRYYFDGAQMVKIATFSYAKDGGVITNYVKYVIDIEEFSAVPDETYFELPAELKDVTKR